MTKRADFLGPALLLPAAGAALGGIALAVAAAGTGSRLWLAIPIFGAGVAAALLPFRFGLPVAVVLASFNGFMIDFVGHGATYWNEVFAGLVVVRSLAVRRPSTRELAAGGVVLVVFAAYLAVGTGLEADAWGMKVLLLSAAVGWAVARLGVGRREWRGVYYGLCASVAANLVLELWQRSKGAEGLTKLGLLYGERVREITNGGALRAFGSFTSAAPLSYALAIAFSAWAGFALSSNDDRRLAIRTAWVVPTAAIGLYLTIDRTAVLALLAALLALGMTFRRDVLVPAVVAVGAAVTLAATLPGTEPFRHQLVSAGRARPSLWKEYLADLRPFGRGPATAGSAYGKVAPTTWRTPLRVPALWDVQYERILMRGRQYPVVGSYSRRLPRLVVRADARAIGSSGRLTIMDGRRTLLDRTIGLRRTTKLAVAIPEGKDGERGLDVALTRPVPSRYRPGPYPETLVNLVTNPSFESSTAGWYAYQGWRGGGGTTITTPRGLVIGKRVLEVGNAEGDPLGNQGVEYGAFPTRKGARYTVSALMKGLRGGELIYLYVQHPPSLVTALSPKLGITSRWERRSFTWTAWATDPEVRVWIRSANTGGRQTYFLDGVQVEEAERPTAYCDGSIRHCRWGNRPNASRSYRAASALLARGLGAVPNGAPDELRITGPLGPSPKRTPFSVSIGSEEIRIVSALGPRIFRVRRGWNRTTPARHLAGETVWAGPEPAADARARARRPSRPKGSPPEIELRNLRFEGLPVPRTDAERIWQRWFERTPAALQSDGPGLVDNLYVSWIWQYGLLGLGLIVLWLGVLLRPLVRPKSAPADVTAALVGVFLVVAAVVVNVWEEAPIDLLAALVLAHAWSRGRSTEEAS